MTQTREVTIGNCRLINADCREVLGTLGHCDLLLTDPPYGIGVDGQKISTSSHGGRKPYEFRGWDDAPPDADTFTAMFRLTKNQIIWGANYFASVLPPSMGWLVWDKGQDICSSDCELAFTSFDKALRRLVLNRVELQRDGAIHPTQKPLKLMRWCLDFAGQCQTVLDPYMGSGTVPVACIRTERECIGIEKDAKHFDDAVRRIRAEWERKQSELPFDPPPTFTQRRFEGVV